jgi:DNA-binding CsgD family transcriptional regulator
MFDLLTARPAEPHLALAAGCRPAHATSAGAAYGGPERRSATTAPAWRWLAAALDEIDYGMLLLDADAQLLHVNHAAHADLDREHPLQLLGRELRARHARDVAPLHAALDAALRRGLRRLLTLGPERDEVSLSVVPLGAIEPDGRRVTLVMLGKRRVCGELAVQAFARSHHLTPGETRVLVALCEGLRPIAAAAQHGVAISTVRTQIGSIRAKTRTGSIRELVQKVAALPPLLGVLRGGAAGTVLQTLAGCAAF